MRGLTWPTGRIGLIMRMGCNPFLLFIRLLFIKTIKELGRALSGYGHISQRLAGPKGRN